MQKRISGVIPQECGISFNKIESKINNSKISRCSIDSLTFQNCLLERSQQKAYNIFKVNLEQ